MTMLGENDGDRAIWLVYPGQPVLIRVSEYDHGQAWAWRLAEPCQADCNSAVHRVTGERERIHVEWFLPGTVALAPVEVTASAVLE